LSEKGSVIFEEIKIQIPSLEEYVDEGCQVLRNRQLGLGFQNLMQRILEKAGIPYTAPQFFRTPYGARFADASLEFANLEFKLNGSLYTASQSLKDTFILAQEELPTFVVRGWWPH
jgi:hypothetical protein